MALTREEARTAILALIDEGWRPASPIGDDDDLFERHSIHGDDASGFMEAFFARFAVNADGYRWYFHHGEEGWSPGGLLFKPPWRRVTRIPVTLAILTEAACTRRWPLQYPAHTLPARRWDIMINQVLAVAVVVALLVGAWVKFGG